MNERLKQFLTMENLTPARFADIMEIQRSGISHLLAGRNKPSFEFIQKMLLAFPNLSPEWLILGKGKPYKENNSVPAPAPVAEIQHELFSEPEVETEDNTEDLPDFEQDTSITEPSYRSENPIMDVSPIPVGQNSAKKIARITVFFTDGTFEER